MNEMRAQAERNVMPKVGASFSLGEDGGALFAFVADPSTIVGPRPATDADKEQYAAEWEAFRAAALSAPAEADLKPAPAPFNGADLAKFDHNGDGIPGGSRKGQRRRKA